MKDWNKILATDVSWKECYPKVGKAARNVLDKLDNEAHISTSWLIKSICEKSRNPVVARAARTRMARALRALAKVEDGDGLRHYHFTSEAPDHFRPGQTSTHYFWRNYQAPPLKQYCEVCGQELPEE